MNQTVKNTLAKIAKRTDEWDHYLPSALFAVRTIRQETTKFSPFELVYGRDPRREYGVTQRDTGSYEDKVWAYVTRDLDRLQRIRKKAWEFIEKAQDRQQKKIAEKPEETERLKIGDEILLYRNIVEASWSAKLKPKWEGPFFVQDIKGTSIFLQKPDGNILKTAVHQKHIKKYHGRKH